MLAQHRMKVNSLTTASCRPPAKLYNLHNRPHRRPLQVAAFQAEQAQTSSMATEQGSSSKPARLSSTDLFDAMCTMLGGLEESRLVGYAGQWRTWDVGTDPASPPALIDDSVNIRLWRITDATQRSVKQANLYQAPAKMAGPSTRFLPYLTGNAMSGRPDGYGLRVWEFKPDSDLINPDASVWRGNPQLAERSMRVLTVPGRATTIINSALPSGFEEGHQPRFWVLEFIIKEAGADDRRWSSMNWYELGALVVNRSINEDNAVLPDDLETRHIDPKDFPFAPRRDSMLEDVDDYVLRQGRVSPTGIATRFEYDSNGSLTSSSSPCSWSLGAAAAAGGDNAAAAAAGALVYQAYPDMSYCRVPRSLKELLEGGGRPSVVFEGGSVLRDGSLGRWLLEYSTAGDRLIKAATYEHYPAAQSA